MCQDWVSGAYVCPDGAVSRVIYFSRETDTEMFKTFLEGQLGKDSVNMHDLRVATRYGWELKGRAYPEISNVFKNSVVKQIYWTVYPKTEAERRQRVFMCQSHKGMRGCGKLFSQPIESENRLCQRCHEIGHNKIA